MSKGLQRLMQSFF